jgi:RNA-directed DNA polymerase
MDAERQQGRPYPRPPHPGPQKGSRHDTPGNGRSGAGVPEEPQTTTASDPARALTERLMEEVCHPDNLNQAYRRVKANKGAPGVDGMTIAFLPPWVAEDQDHL